MISYPPHLSSSTPMDTNRPSPRQLQGPRPTPLKVSKESYKINKKPPAVPQNPNQALPPPKANAASSQQQLPPRPPVIIYTVSPKIIHTNPSDFMTLVQRLTGPDSLRPPAAAALSPAARFAAIENADRFSPRNNNSSNTSNNIIDVGDDEEKLLYMGSSGGGGGSIAAVCSNQPGILSPMPSSLQPIPPSFFSPISSYDPGSFAFLHDLSPGPNAGFLFSPHNLLATPTVPSPGALWDLFNHF